MQLNLTAAADDDGRRLDRILRKALDDMPLSAIHRLLRKGGVLVDGKPAPADLRVSCGQSITVNLSRGGVQSGFAGLLKAQRDFRSQKAKSIHQETLQGQEENKAAFSLPLLPLLPLLPHPLPPRLCVSAPPRDNNQAIIPEIIFEGAGLLILNKPAGLAVHDKGRDGSASLEELVRDYLKPRLPPSLSFRPGPLHRLDKPSSGLIAFSTSLEGAQFFSALMRERKIKKFYLALVKGAVEKDEVWHDELLRDSASRKSLTSQTAPAAKASTTRVSPLASNADYSLLLAEIETGRTHQIRAQASSRGHPLLGDKKYGGGSSADGFLLHAWRMIIPGDPPLPQLIEAPLPENFRRKIVELFGEDMGKALSTNDTNYKKSAIICVIRC